MNRQTNQLHVVALLAGVLLVGGLFYLFGSGFYGQLHRFTPSREVTSTVAVPADRLAQLQRTAHQHQLLLASQEAAATSSFVTSLDNRRGIAASVIGRPPQSPYDTLLLDVGREDGITLAAGVWWPAGVYLGNVVRVDKRTALVQLTTAPGVNHPATVDGVPVTTVGRGGDGLYMEVPDGEEIAIGTAVISDVYELPIGVVSAVEKLPTTNLQAVYAVRFVSNATVENVYVQER